MVAPSPASKANKSPASKANKSTTGRTDSGKKNGPVKAPSSARERRRIKKLDAILDAAELLLMQLGLDGLTMAKLAAQVDVTAGALYRYFDSKDALFVQLQVRALNDVGTAVRAKWQALDAAHCGGGSARDRGDEALASLLAANAVHGQFAVDKPARFGLLAMGMAEQRDLIADDGSLAVWQGVQVRVGEIAERVDVAVRAGVLEAGDEGRRALLLMMAGQGMLQLRKMSRHVSGIPPVVELSAEVCRALLLSWGAEPAAVARAGTRLG